MKISIIGTGTVGQAIAARLTQLGNEVMLGTRNVKEKLSSDAKDSYGNPSFSEWHKSNTGVKLGTFEEAARFGEIVINATNGGSSIAALKLAGAANLSGKILIDIANPLDFSKGMPPSLLPGLNNTNSLGEEIQKTFPGAKVVKTLNTMWCGLMVNPGLIGGGEHINYICGNDDAAKAEVKRLLVQIGWKNENLLDIGDISGARASESLLPIWLRVMGSIQTGVFNFRLIR
ncbi:MAG: NAD(P)-binding domain-containing protein [Bacteroidales bacterium]|nr:NAD(P)-binding domain-containing protein [Bacteroidales bacterium]MBK8883866.1 NAD(P)-binding domain-containing protein [Bacteroidales bacterium]